MSSAVQKLAKPELRGLYRSSLRKHLAIAVVLGIASSYAWKFLVQNPRKEKYAEFYKTYDALKDYERIKALGILPPPPPLEKREY